MDSGSGQPARQSLKGGDGWTVVRRARRDSRLVSRVSWYVALIVALGTWHVERVSAQQLGQQELPSAIMSRQVSPRFQRVGMEQGLSQGYAADILQDRRGFMWFPTQDGLNRWDGYDMKVYKHEPFDSTTLSSSWLWGIDEDDSGNIWIASRSGLNRLNPITDEVKFWKHDPENPESIISDELSDVLVASDGTVWIGTDSGLDRMDPKHPGIFKHYRPDESDPTSLSYPQIYMIEEDSRGTIWVGGPNGLNRLDDPETGAFTRYFADSDPGCDFDNHPGITAAGGVLERPEEPGVLWVPTEKALVRLDTGTGETRSYKVQPQYTCSGVFKPVQDPLNPGVLWAGYGDGGLVRFDIRSEFFQRFAHDPNAKSGLPEGRTESVFVDRSGVVWVSTTPAGLSFFDPSSVGVALTTRVKGDKNSLIGPQVASIFLGRDGILWVISSDGSRWGLTALDRATGKATQYEHDPRDPTSISQGFYWGSVVEDLSGNIWVSPDQGLDLLDRRSGKFTHIKHDPSNPSSLASNRTGPLFVDHTGTLWVTHPGALSRMTKINPPTFVPYQSDAEDDATILPSGIRAVSEDRAGFIWLAQTGGISRLDPISGKATRYLHNPDDPNTLAGPIATHVHERRVEPGIVWVTMYGAGLDRLDPSTGEVKHFTERDGLSNNGAYGMLEDEQGRLWISTNRGISRFDPATETFRNYGMEIGLQGLEFNSGSFHRGYQGEFFFGGQFGLNSFFPNEITENSTPPQVTLVDLKLFNESVSKTGAIDIGDGLDQVDEIDVNYDQRDIAFDFTAFHFTDPHSNEYAYKLEGWNDDWVYIGNQRSASFTNLDPGKYVFHVKAANSDGVWNEEGTSVRLVVEPPFWATWWFRTFAILLFGGVIFGGYRLRTRQLEARAHELEQEVGKRTVELKASNEQLEQSHTIVEAINRETSFRRLLTKILEEARVIPGVEKATALVYMKNEGLFRARASSGWDVEAMQNIGLTQRQARRRYVEQAEEVADDIFAAKDVSSREGSEQMAEFGNVASFIVLRVRVDDEVAGYLVFDNLTDPDAFEQRDVELLERLREHIQSAFIKTRILEDLQTTLADLQSTQDRLVQSEKMASLGQLTAGIAHEIKNPLNFVNNFSDLSVEMLDELIEAIRTNRSDIPDNLAEELDDIVEGLRTNAAKIHEHGSRADGIVQSMLQHSHGGEGQRQDVDINALVDEYLNLAYHGIRARDVEFNATLVKNFDERVGRVEAVPQDLGRVLLNLFGNAFDALRENGGGRLESGEGPTVTVSTSRNGSNVEIRIADNGPGIPSDVREKIFEPFFTTKPTGSGTGLGLSMSYDIVTKGHGGELEVQSEEGKGATFIVRLPA